MSFVLSCFLQDAANADTFIKDPKIRQQYDRRSLRSVNTKVEEGSVITIYKMIRKKQAFY